MAWLPIAQIVPQYEDLNGLPASGYVIKLYAAGTNTPIQIATDNTGGTLLDDAVLNSRGYPETGGTVFIPHIDQAYKIALYVDQAAADSDTGALWNPDNIRPAANASGTQWIDSSNTATFATTTTFTVPGDVTTEFDVGRRVRVSDVSTLYGTITASVFSSVTTVTVLLDSGVLSSSLTAVELGILSGTNQSIPVIEDLKATADILNFTEGLDVASASSADIWTGNGNTRHITGAVTIADFATAPNVGASRWIIFDSTPTLTRSATLNVRGGEDVIAIAGDMAYVYADTVTQLDVIYFRMDRGPNNINESLVTRASVASTTISTTETSESVIGITIPASWNTYDVEINGATTIDETGASASDTLITLRVREGTGIGGASIRAGQIRMGVASPDDRKEAPIFGYLEGETAVGSVTWSLTSLASANTTAYSLINVMWQVEAKRTS